MTSSLVGSEMCIRDRRNTPGEPESFSKNKQMVTLSKKNSIIKEEHGLKPVSYTHLTLPTICSV
eukprot:12205330-Prorocentrum_lima.AAC.1